MTDMSPIIATIASHSCLQILKGAKDEGFSTLAIAKSANTEFYEQFPFIDTLVTPELFAQENTQRVILVPHGSFVAYGMKETKAAFFGNKKILEIEADRNVQHEWMSAADVAVPRIFTSAAEVDRPVIIKYFGARGGQGYRVAANKKEVEVILSRHSEQTEESREEAENRTGSFTSFRKTPFLIQEYIVGTPVYCQYFYSVVRDRLEIMGFDRRYETDVDGIGRVPSILQQKIAINPTFTVIGNLPLVVRESLLPEFYAMGKRVIATAKKMTPQGLWGPFCLETIITPDQKITIIEISARIVAGTNLYTAGSPYSDLLFDEPMSTGRRIAREIKEAGETGRMKEVLTY